MELREFIKDTLVEIKSGVHDANLEFAKQAGRTLGNDFTAPFVLDAHNRTTGYSYVNFDVAVTVSSESTKSGGAGIKIAVASIGGEAGTTATQQNVTRIKFSVSIHETTG